LGEPLHSPSLPLMGSVTGYGDDFGSATQPPDIRRLVDFRSDSP
jgi:hypothetical protein